MGASRRKSLASTPLIGNVDLFLNESSVLDLFLFVQFSNKAEAVIPAVTSELILDQVSPQSLSAASLVRSK